MSSTTGSGSRGGIGVLGLLGVVFVTLKLIGVIDWSWWWVTLPFWGGYTLVLGLVAGVAIWLAALDFIGCHRTGKTATEKRVDGAAKGRDYLRKGINKLPTGEMPPAPPSPPPPRSSR